MDLDNTRAFIFYSLFSLAIQSWDDHVLPRVRDVQIVTVLLDAVFIDWVLFDVNRTNGKQ